MACAAVPMAISGDLVDRDLMRRGASRAGHMAALAKAARALRRMDDRDFDFPHDQTFQP
jgi:hypothetical protein